MVYYYCSGSTFVFFLLPFSCYTTSCTRTTFVGNILNFALKTNHLISHPIEWSLFHQYNHVVLGEESPQIECKDGRMREWEMASDKEIPSNYLKLECFSIKLDRNQWNQLIHLIFSFQAIIRPQCTMNIEAVHVHMQRNDTIYLQWFRWSASLHSCGDASN